MSQLPRENESPVPSTSADAQPGYPVDSNFYVDMGSIIFLVEDTLFRASRYPFIKGSATFAAKFIYPQNDEITEEQKRSNPIYLPEATTADFKPFLQVVHPLDCPPFEAPPFGVQEWASVLRLSQLWDFDMVVGAVMPRLDAVLNGKDYPFESILLGREFKRSKWLLKGYRELVQRAEALTNAEAVRIGWPAAIIILRAREGVLPLPISPPSTSSYKCQNVSCTQDLTLPSSDSTLCNYCRSNRDTYAVCWKAFSVQYSQQQQYKTRKLTGPLEEMLEEDFSRFN